MNNIEIFKIKRKTESANMVANNIKLFLKKKKKTSWRASLFIKNYFEFLLLTVSGWLMKYKKIGNIISFTRKLSHRLMKIWQIFPPHLQQMKYLEITQFEALGYYDIGPSFLISSKMSIFLYWHMRLQISSLNWAQWNYFGQAVGEIL